MAAEGSHAAPASSSGAPAATAKKDRHVVTWTPQEDDLLREQIALHGTNNWTSISAKFKDKTSRQCRRRWFTYLNTECKKGGWSAEEDMLLCEAQKILGNKWTEIAKVVAGRTDNAVKNRFTTLCKKRAKDEALLYKENNLPCASTDTDRYLLTRDKLISAGVDVSSLPAKKIRYDLSDPGQRIGTNDDRLLVHQVTERNQLRQPLGEISQNSGNSKKTSINVSGTVGGRKFLPEGDSDSKLAALLKQAELLSSLAVKVNSENSKESLDEARKELQEYMKQMEKAPAEGGTSDTIFLLDDLKDLIEDLRNSTEQNLQTGLQLHEQPDDDNKASNSKSLLDDARIDASIIECFTFADGLIVSPSKEDPVSTIEEVCAEVSVHFPEKAESKDGSDSARKDLADSKYDSPMQKFPAFQSVADAIPSPKFSESERKFLLSLLELSSPGANIGHPRDPSCKRALLGSL